MAKRTSRGMGGLGVGVASVMLAVVLLAGTWVLFVQFRLLGFPSRRSVPINNGDNIAWQGGSVSVWDYSYDFGGYDHQIEWVGPKGKRKVLAHVGDVPASLDVLPDGRLKASYYQSQNYDEGKRLRLIILTWRDRHSPPIKIERSQ